MEEFREHNLSEQNWNQVTEEVRKNWASLSEADISRIEHDFDSLADLVAVKTGLTHEETEQRLDDIIARCGTQTTMDIDPSVSRSASGSAGTLGSGTIEDDSEEQAP
ncbi:hypothetical protein [Bdellovibrio sp. HCB209]|uniref:hypothetical protein n=1 Tax=Bdellovibrio sp. HCB209 TaxID=3394354 RepID=UPI0039B4B40B